MAYSTTDKKRHSAAKKITRCSSCRMGDDSIFSFMVPVYLCSVTMYSHFISSKRAFPAVPELSLSIKITLQKILW